MQAQLVSQDQRDSVAYYFNGATTEAIDLYIDPAGSDVTGKGTVALPYATVDRAKLDIPRRVEHMVHLHVAAGAYGPMPDWDSFSYGENGWISVDASGAMADVSAVLTVDAGGAVSVHGDNVVDVPIVGGGLGVDAYRNKFMQIITGADAGYFLPIIGNTATALRVGPVAWLTIAAGNTVKIIEPAATFTGGDLNVTDSGTTEAHLFFLGVKITAGNVFFNGMQASMVGCELAITTTGDFSRGEFTTSLSLPSTGVDYAPWVAAGPWLSGSVISGAVQLLLESMSLLYAVLFSEVKINLKDACYMCYVAARNETNCAIQTWSACAGSFDVAYAHSKSTMSAFKFGDGSAISCYDIFANAGKYGVELEAGVSARINTFGGTAANIVTAGALVGGGARIASKSCTAASVGAVAVAWGSGAAASAWPAANNKVDDAIAALVVGAN